jgi:signal transduction histidine kinase
MLARLSGSVARISQFTADASHELRSPLSLIRTTAELATRQKHSDEDYRADMLQILSEAERMSHLIDSLLLLARADAGETELERELIECATVLQEAVAEATPLAHERNVTLTLHVRSNAPIRADSLAFRRLLFILIDNAIKYTPPGGSVDVELDETNGSAICTVRDTGIGISESDRPHIFDRFWRADKVRSRGAGGAGLGLSIAKWIAERHDATITVESKPGEGTECIVRIPATAA